MELNYLQNPHNGYDQITYLKNLFSLPKNDFIGKKIKILIERIHKHNPYENDEKQQQRFKQTEGESIILTRLTLQEKLEIEKGKSKKPLILRFIK